MVVVRLKNLVLSGNQLESLLPYQFPPLPDLKKIDLSNAGWSRDLTFFLPAKLSLANLFFSSVVDPE